MLSNHLIFCLPLLPLPLIFPNIRVFSSESAFPIRWSKYWCFSHSPSNEYSWLIFFIVDWFDLLAVQGTLKSLLQYHNLKAIKYLRTQPSLWSLALIKLLIEKCNKILTLYISYVCSVMWCACVFGVVDCEWQPVKIKKRKEKKIASIGSLSPKCLLNLFEPLPWEVKRTWTFESGKPGVKLD